MRELKIEPESRLIVTAQQMPVGFLADVARLHSHELTHLVAVNDHPWFVGMSLPTT
jgi:hypothetical protein